MCGHRQAPGVALAIVRVALPVAVHQLFDYWSPAGLTVQPGSIVVARLGLRALTGVAVALADSSDVAPERLLPIEQVVPGLPPLPAELIELASFIAGYYQQPIGLCLAQMLPPLAARSVLRAPIAEHHRLTAAGRDALARARGRALTLRSLLQSAQGAATADIRPLGDYTWRLLGSWRRDGWVEAVPALAHASSRATELNADQRAALAEAIPDRAFFRPSLLQGVTGSGKTAVYLEAAGKVIAAGRQALLLVPEIGLTPQLEQRIADALPGTLVALLHSGLGAAERRRHWLAAASGHARLIVGTRLAVFAPAPDLGLIIVDEEHDGSFKQQEGVRYHARDVAIYRASRRAVPVILGSATPSLETYAQASRGRYRWLRLPLRATAQTALPPVRLVPNRAAEAIEGIGPALREAIRARLDRHEQSLLFVNRRGYAPALLCAGCGWKAQCPRCAARLVVHREAAGLRCHHCGHAATLPLACPECGNQDLLPLGTGTQRLERALGELYPTARIVRVDRDSTRGKGAFASMREAVEAGDIDILVGTQMLAKGHDFARLTLVGVLGADNALYSAEFRATERLFALLEQVAGRAGRRELAGEVLVQTDFPQHPLYAALAAHDFDRFASVLLAERDTLALPPFAHLALLLAEARSSEVLQAFVGAASERGRSLAATGAHACEVYPAVPAALARRAGLERAQVLVQSRDRAELQIFLPRWRGELERLAERRVRWSLDVDPLGFG
ncbi:MAG: primosomal protein N' [Casimicrobiaceae bacterium]